MHLNPKGMLRKLKIELLHAEFIEISKQNFHI
jgi:hypothetical protein